MDDQTTRPATAVREGVAKAIYDKMPYEDGQPGRKPEWTPNGNSKKQDEARRYADAALEMFALIIGNEPEHLPDATVDEEPIGDQLEALGPGMDREPGWPVAMGETVERLIETNRRLTAQLRAEGLHTAAATEEIEKLRTENARLRVELVAQIKQLAGGA